MSRTLRFMLAAGAGAAAYSFYEPFRYHLVARDVPVRWAGSPLDVLHLSDTHLASTDHKLQGFLRSLPDRLEREPDLVVVTGDMIQGDGGIDPLLEALAPIQARYGRFYVLGSHDYYVSSGPSYSKYFSSETSKAKLRHTDSERLEWGLQDQGWVSLCNDSATVTIEGRRILVSGVDDPYLKRHRIEHISRSRDDDLAIGLTHAPDLTSEWALSGFDLVVAGHTHAGQVRVPFVGALVTNCSLPSALAGGLTRIGATWLHVSPGLGTGRFAPIRFLARPEGTLLRLRGVETSSTAR